MTLWTEDARLAALYDIKCAGRHDHDFYLELADQLGAEAVVDIGCGTGVFAVDVARAADERRRRVIGVDPAQPMLDIAAARPGGDLVTWIHGDASDVPASSADLVIMMGHVAQYFVSDAAWNQVLADAHRILHAGGILAFEVRNPDRNWADRWTQDLTTSVGAHPDGGTFTSWVQVVDTIGAADSFTMTHEEHTVLPDGIHLSARETLRFRRPEQVISTLKSAGFAIGETYGDWDHSPFSADSDEFIAIAVRQPVAGPSQDRG